jgi:hypothetical protein
MIKSIMIEVEVIVEIRKEIIVEVEIDQNLILETEIGKNIVIIIIAQEINKDIGITKILIKKIPLEIFIEKKEIVQVKIMIGKMTN